MAFSDGLPPSPKPQLIVVVNQAWVAAKFRTRLMQTLRTQGYRVTLLTDCRAGAGALPACCDELCHVPMAASKISVIADLRTLLAYRSHFRRLRPGAILSFTIKPNVYASLAARALDAPVICNVTGLGSAASLGGLLGMVVRWLYRRAFFAAAWIFFQNRDDARALQAQALVPTERWSVLPGSGVDTLKYVPTSGGPRPQRVRFCMLARLLRDKGVVEFAEAARRLRAEGGEAEFQLWGILDPADPRCVTRQEITDWEDAGVLRFFGEAEDALAPFHDADVVVLPSYYAEGLPRTLLEAASMALPVITTDMPGCRDAVVDRRTGFLCPPRDVEALADAMREMIALGAAGRQALGAAARQRALTEFDESIVIDAYLDRLLALGCAPMQPSRL